MGRTVITGAEVAAAGRVLTQVARSAAGSGGGPASASQRAAAYTDFQASVAALLTWAELTETVQRSAARTPTPTRPVGSNYSSERLIWRSWVL